jgi:type II restriction/modification system DNA methylase subunit YeeA
MTPDQFITKWKAIELKERSAAHSHFDDLCRLLDEPTPTDADPTGSWYCFERGATKASGGDGWADVWKRGHFGWEYKGKRKNLDAAFGQLQQYALALENPPLLIVCDLDRFVIRTNWTNTVSEKHEFSLEDLREPLTLQKLKWAMSDPEKLRPGKTRQDLTEDAAGEFAALAQNLRNRGHDSGQVAHFINRLVFCMFAEDVDLLPAKMFVRMLEAARPTPTEFQKLASSLFAAMRDGGLIGFERIDWFNGGLFDDDQALPLTSDDIALCLRAAALDWSEIDPSIFGTLFVRGLDPAKRSETGAEYTDREKIMMIVEPVITQPLLREWEMVRISIAALIEPAASAVEEAIATASGYPELADDVKIVESHLTARPQLELFGDLTKQRRVRALDAVRASLRAADRALTTAKEQGRAAFNAFLARLRAFRVLDPACGSGNFLYLALVELKNIERRVSIEGELLGFPPEFPSIGPEALLGIEINAYAAELARVSVWIGEIQWMRRSGFNIGRTPILKPLTTIECRDAIIDADGSPALWPPANVIIGNPPYLGNKSMIGTLGEEYTIKIRSAYYKRLSGAVDFVCYWFDGAREAIASGRVERVGLVATQSIRKGANRAVLDCIRQIATIYDAWSDEEWTVDGADVRVSLICFAREQHGELHLDGKPVQAIHADLSAGEFDITTAKRLMENLKLSFQGPVLVGSFDIPGDTARQWLLAPPNANGKENSTVLRPYVNGQDLTKRRPPDTWVIDFAEMDEAEAAYFSMPFAYVVNEVKPQRDKNRRPRRRLRWWQHGETVPGLRAAISPLRRFIATPRVSRHRVFLWLHASVLPDS